MNKTFPTLLFLLLIWHLPQGCNWVYFIFVLICFHFLISHHRNVRLQWFVFFFFCFPLLPSSPPGWLLPCVKTWKSPLAVHFHSSIFIYSILGEVAWCFSAPLLEDPWGDLWTPPTLRPPTRWTGSHISSETWGENTWRIVGEFRVFFFFWFQNKRR